MKKSMENWPSLSHALEIISQRLQAKERFRVVLTLQHRDETPEWTNAELASRLAEKLRDLEARGILVNVEAGLQAKWTATPSGVSSSRGEEWRTSRMALLQALNRIDPNANAQLSASLSHCPGLSVAGVSLCEPGTQSAAIGVDCEPKDRKFSKAVESRIANPDDHAADLPALALWCLKEAVYKTGQASSATFRVMAIQIEAVQDGIWFGSCRIQDQVLPLAAAVADGFIVAIAVSSAKR